MSCEVCLMNNANRGCWAMWEALQLTQAGAGCTVRTQYGYYWKNTFMCTFLCKFTVSQIKSYIKAHSVCPSPFEWVSLQTDSIDLTYEHEHSHETHSHETHTQNTPAHT